MDNHTSDLITYSAIEQIQLRKAMLLKDIQKDDNKIRTQWHALFTRPDALKANATPSRRLTSMVNTGAGFFDAFILGWKLYRKFKK